MNFNTQGDINGQVSCNLNKDPSKFRLDGSEKNFSPLPSGWEDGKCWRRQRPPPLPSHTSVPPSFLVIVSPFFFFFPPPPLFETTGCHAEVRGTEKRTRQSGQADKPAYERMMSKVRKTKKKRKRKGGQGGRREAFVVLLRGEHTYPVRLNQSRRVEGGGRKGWVGWGGVWE